MPAEPSRAELKYLVERQREEIRAIVEVGRLLHATTDPQELARRVASYLRQTFPLALCGILLLQQRTLQVLRFTRVAQVDLSTAIREICSKPGPGLPEPLQESELTLSVEEASAPGHWAEAPAAYLRSTHHAALLFSEKPIGRLALFSVKAEGFSQEERHVVDIVADQLAAALHNAFLLEELRQADRMKTDLLAVISHELRIPLTAVQEGSALLAEGILGPLTPEQSDFVLTIQRNAKRLQQLVEKVELASHILTGKVSYRMEQTDLLTVLKELEAAFLPQAQSKGVTLSLTEGSRPGPCRGDPRRLNQALSELVENALHATPGGGRVTGVLTPEAGELRFELTDTGEGLPAEALAQGLDRFLLVGGISDRKTGGLGLGLFLARRIVEAHRGRLEIQSERGRGTRILVQLPAGPAG